MTHCLTWYGGKYKVYRKDFDYLMLLGYGKARYYDDVKLDGVLITRQL